MVEIDAREPRAIGTVVVVSRRFVADEGLRRRSHDHVVLAPVSADAVHDRAAGANPLKNLCDQCAHVDIVSEGDALMVDNESGRRRLIESARTTDVSRRC